MFGSAERGGAVLSDSKVYTCSDCLHCVYDDFFDDFLCLVFDRSYCVEPDGSVCGDFVPFADAIKQ